MTCGRCWTRSEASDEPSFHQRAAAGAVFSDRGLT
jgi:hypothetical protein